MVLLNKDRETAARVVVIAGSIEGIDAMARLLRQLPATFPVPIVAHVHGREDCSLIQLTTLRSRFPSGLEIVVAQSGEQLHAGFVYLIPPENQMLFTDVGMLGSATNQTALRADRLLESAARWYRSGVIGVVLSGLGNDGTHGLLAITEVDGIRVVQSPCEAEFSGMPMSALFGDHVQHAVMLDQMGTLLANLVAGRDRTETANPEVHAEVGRLVSAAEMNLAQSLDRSIDDILRLIRRDLTMDMAFVTRLSGDLIVISHAAAGPSKTRIQGTTHPRHRSLCQRVLDGYLPAVMPDVEALRTTHDIPTLDLTVGAYMATPVWLRDGMLYGMLCCLRATASQELDQRHYQRLQMFAMQISRLVNNAGGR